MKLISLLTILAGPYWSYPASFPTSETRSPMSDQPCPTEGSPFSSQSACGVDPLIPDLLLRVCCSDLFGSSSFQERGEIYSSFFLLWGWRFLPQIAQVFMLSPSTAGWPGSTLHSCCPTAVKEHRFCPLWIWKVTVISKMPIKTLFCLQCGLIWEEKRTKSV